MTAPRPKNDLHSEIERYRKSLEENPGSRLFAALADAMRRSGDINGAVTVAEEGLKRHPRYLGGMVVLGQAYADNRQYDRAKELFLQVVRMNPENIVAQRALAGIYEELAESFNAMRTYAILNILDPTDKKVRARLQELEEARAAMGRGPDSGIKPFSKPPLQETPVATEPTTADVPEAETPPVTTISASESSEASLPFDSSALPAEAVEEEAPQPMVADETAPEEKPEIDQRLAGLNQFFDDDKTQELELTPVARPSAVLPVPAPEGSETDAADEGSSTQVVPPEPELEAPLPPPPQLNIEEKLDLFFGGADLDRISIGSRAEQFVVRAAGEAIDGTGPGLSDRSAPTVEEGLVITSSKLGAIFWSQGFKEKAVEVMAGEVRSRPDDETLRKEFDDAARAVGIDPEEKLASLPPVPTEGEPEPNPASTYDPEGSAAANNSDSAGEEPEPDDSATDPRIKILRSYLNRIRKDKES